MCVCVCVWGGGGGGGGGLMLIPVETCSTCDFSGGHLGFDCPLPLNPPMILLWSKSSTMAILISL